MQPPHDRIAKRRAEINDQLADLDRDDAQRYSADNEPITAPVEPRRGSALRSTVFLIVLTVVAAGLIGLAVTLTRLAGKDFSNAHRQGTARVTACDQHGPISNEGFGYWQSCTATITWDAGGTDRTTVKNVFTTSDLGADVRVGDLGKYRTSTLLVRADAPHRPWLAWIGYTVGLIAFIPALVAILSIRALLRFPRRR